MNKGAGCAHFLIALLSASLASPRLCPGFMLSAKIFSNVRSAIPSPPSERGLVLNGNRHKEFAGGKGPLWAERAGASESLGQDEGSLCSFPNSLWLRLRRAKALRFKRSMHQLPGTALALTGQPPQQIPEAFPLNFRPTTI
jgi:hypothetical protein